VSAYLRWMAGPSRPGGGARREPPRDGDPRREHDLASEQTVLLDAIASLVYAVGAYGTRGECQYRRVGGSAHVMGCAALLEAMERLARSVVGPTGGTAKSPTAKSPTSELGHIGAAGLDISTTTDRYRLRAIRLRPGLLGSEGSVLVVADRLRDDALDRARIRERFRLTERETDVAMLLADRRRNAEIARALGISVHTARHHIERVLLKLGGCKRRDVQRVLGSGIGDTEDD
jgi:DNA-binding CsgD family transcriptional regulator